MRKTRAFGFKSFKPISNPKVKFRSLFSLHSCSLHKLSLAKVNESIHRRDTHRLDAAAHGVRARRLLAAGLLPASPPRKETRGTGWRMWCRHLLAAGLLPPTPRRTARESKSSAATIEVESLDATAHGVRARRLLTAGHRRGG